MVQNVVKETLRQPLPFSPQALRTDQQVLLGARPFHKQFILLPHELVSSLFDHPHIFHPLFTGEPGRLQWYWSQNADLMDVHGELDSCLY